MVTFRIGEKVVYPNHGVGTIEQISTRSLVGAAEKFYLLRINGSSLTVMVPFGNVESVGLRKIIKHAEAERILVYLSNGHCETPADWKWRFKENSEKMRTGSLLQVAEVMKSLLKLAGDKPLSFREKKMLDRARQMLISELSISRTMRPQEASDLLQRSLTKASLTLPPAL